MCQNSIFAEKESLKQSIYEIVCLIPCGRATSYSAIAKAVGYPNFSRLVGKIMSQCPSDANIPAHRVVNSQGYLSAKDAFGAPGQMQKRLELEGIVVVNDRIRNWKHVFWNPLTEI
jgi:methylated-DNA-protein-cysteine methyltransferase-like protein